LKIGDSFLTKRMLNFESN